MSMTEYFFILIEASICMVIINALTLYVSRKGLIAKILLMTSPAIAASHRSEHIVPQRIRVNGHAYHNN